MLPMRALVILLVVLSRALARGPSCKDGQTDIAWIGWTGDANMDAVSLLQLGFGPQTPSLAMQRRSKTGGHDVTLMVNVIEKDADYIQVRLKHLLKHQHYDGMKRVLVIDGRGADLDASFVARMTRLQEEGLIDSWGKVDYSKAYIQRVRRLAKWKTDFLTRGHQGNLVYFYMLDTCATTYCVHFDLDIAFLAQKRPSWIDAGIQLLETNPDALEVQPAHLREWVGSSHVRVPNMTIMCGGPTFISARYYLMHAQRYKELLQSALAQDACGGDRHWEEYVSCAACHLKWKGIDLMDDSSSRAIHFPMRATSPIVVDSILTRCVEKGIALTRPNGYDALDVSEWEKHDCMTKAG